jgi:hypothetical protein
VRSKGSWAKTPQNLSETKELVSVFCAFLPKSCFQDRVRASENWRSETGKSLIPLAHIFDESW